MTGVKRFRISTGQAVLALAITNLGAAHLYVPTFSYSALGRTGWILPLAAIATSTAGGWVFARLSRRFRGETFFQYAPRVLGRAGGALLQLALLGSLLVFVPLVTRVFTALVGSDLLSRTPLPVISALVLAVSAYAVSHGIEALVRLTQIFSLLVIPAAVLFVMMPLMLPLDPGYLVPLSLSGWKGDLPALLAMLTAYPGFALLAVIAPALDEPSDATRVALWGTVLPALIVVPSVLLPVMTFGWPSASQYARPFWEVLSVVRLNPVLPVQRIAYILTLATRFVTYITLAGYLYAAAEGLQQTLAPRTQRFTGMLWGAVPFLVLVTVLPVGQNLVYRWLQYSHIALAVAGLVLPALLLAAARLRGVGRS